MLFNSFSFLIFFPIVVFLYYLIPNRFRPILLLAASCYFYMVFLPKYILVLLFLITADYFLGKKIEKINGRNKKLLLIISILTNIGTLFFFKYFNFANENISALAGFLHWNYSATLIKIILPLGLSFHVFQSLSYVIEVYRGKYKSENNFLTYALYVMFFPQLVAGPIERPQHLLPQFKLEHNFNSINVRRGLERMLWGFFKKLVIADQIGVIVSRLYYNLPSDSYSLILIIILFSYQLYCDFSGYSDIAIGSALILGYDLSENFDRPYSARSISDFWKRWHISLSSWLRDYLYIPLGGNRVSVSRWYFNIFITFLLIGLWHGANWTFVFFGATHGIYMIIGSATKKARQKFAELTGLQKIPGIRHFIQVLIVFSLVSFGWIFFRAESIGQAFYIISHLGSSLGNIFSLEYILHGLFRGLHLGKTAPMIILFGIIFMEIVQYLQTKKNTFYIFDSKPKIARFAWYYMLIFSILFFGYFGAQPFIYFQF